MKLQDVKDGKIKVTENTAIHYNGNVYRGVRQINALIERIFPDMESSKEKEGTDLNKQSIIDRTEAIEKNDEKIERKRERTNNKGRETNRK